MKVEKVKFLLAAQDLGRAVDFYTKVFHFPKGFVSEHWAELLHGDAIIAFHGGGDGAANPTSLSIQVDDAHIAVAAIKSAGGRILDEPGQRRGEPILLGHFRDTEGNEVMLTQFIG